MSTMVQAAWGLLLSRYSGEKDVVFGVTVSGRPAELVGVEQMVLRSPPGEAGSSIEVLSGGRA